MGVKCVSITTIEQDNKEGVAYCECVYYNKCDEPIIINDHNIRPNSWSDEPVIITSITEYTNKRSFQSQQCDVMEKKRRPKTQVI